MDSTTAGAGARAVRLIENAADAFVGMDASGCVTDWNRAAEALFGWHRDEALGRSLGDLIIRPQDRAAHEHGMRRYQATGTGALVGQAVQVTAQHRDGRCFPVDLTIWSEQDSGSTWGFYAFLRDVSDRVSGAAVAAELAAIVTSSTDAIASADLDGAVRTWNAGAERIYGYSAAEMLGAPLSRLTAPERRADLEERLAQVRDGHPQEGVETACTTRDGRELEMSLTFSPVRDPHGAVTGLTFIGRDITEAKRAERALREAKEQLAAQAAQLAHLAFHDPLTGLANRALLEDRLTQALERHARHGGGVAVLVLDVDDFKTVNDTLGHAAGDQLLTELAARMQAALRTKDTAARLGGDEFAVVLEDLDAAGAGEVAERLVRAFAAPVQAQGRWVVAQASIGVTHTSVSAPDLDPAGAARAPAVLLHDADVAMYTAKAAGKAAWRAYHPSMLGLLSPVDPLDPDAPDGSVLESA